MAAVLLRTTRAAMLEVLDQDYIKFTRAKGMREHLVIYKHALRNASIPIVTVLGLQFGYLLGGAVIVETIFSLPGIGKMTLNAVNTRSYPIVQGGVLVIGLLFMLVNLITDLLYAVLNPRVRYE
jgi:peptide/nickel transport system permease protein